MKHTGTGCSEKILTAAASALRDWHSGSFTLDDCVERLRAAEPEIARSATSIASRSVSCRPWRVTV